MALTDRRRVVVTGLGAITSLGANVTDTWQNILKGKSGIKPITSFDTTNFPVKICGTVDDFDMDEYVQKKDARKMDPFTRFGVVAALQAAKDSGVDQSNTDLSRAGVAVGSGIGGISTIAQNHAAFVNSGARRISPFFIPASIINMVAGQISIYLGLKGPNISVVTACTTGAHNIGLAARMIQHGDADVMVAGGAECASDPLSIGGFAACKALSRRNDEPEKASRPWDKDRDGFVLGEGAGVLVLEEYEHAKKRGAHIYCELNGFGMSADAYHITSPDVEGDGACRAMSIALHDAKLQTSEIGYVNAHGTSTPAGDEVEVFAAKKIFESHVEQLKMSSTKSMIGHLLGAAGAVEAIFTILALRDQVAPPTINLDNPSDGCDINLVAHETQSCKMQYAMSNSFGFGGTNGSLVFGKI